MGEALTTLAAPGTPKVVLAGGTVINADQGFDPIEVVDLQALGLDGITEEGDRLRIGATTTLQAMAYDERVPEALVALALREAPSTLRTLGTIGGLVAHRDADSELLAGLLVYGATVTIIDDGGSIDHDLSDVVASGPGSGIIAAVSIETGGTTASAGTGRTPQDRPIVAAVARRAADGSVRLALCGVSSTPVLVEDVSSLDPPGDFRGSAQYRLHLASILAARVTGEIG